MCSSARPRWSLIFGLTVSTAFTLLLVPVVYWMLYRGSDQLPGGESVTLVPVSEPSL